MKKISLESVKVKKGWLSAAILCCLSVAAIIYLALTFTKMWADDKFYPSENVTEVRMLSDWCPQLKGTAGDTEVYILKGANDGAKMLVLGGVHANEPAGVLSATYLMENAKVTTGTLYVITETNRTGFTCTDPQEASPMFYTVEADGKTRTFRYGSRASNPINQWPDPDIYVHANSGQQLSGSETRNLNRCYPGRTDGNLTEKIAYGLTELVKAEAIDVTIDLHEASPEYQTINTIVFHQDAQNLASEAAFDMELFYDVKISLDASPTNFHGLSHRELGDNTDTLAVLMESCNAAQGRLHGKTSSELVVTGQDDFYVKAYGNGRLPASVTYDENGHPISERVGRHVTGVMCFAQAFSDNHEKKIVIENIGDYEDINKNLYKYLVDAVKE